MVCAAFQSSYILDDQKQAEKFSFFKNDSLILEANANGHKKDIYGMSERKYGYWNELRLLVVHQKDVYSDEVDSLLNSKRLRERAEFDMDSSLAQNVDSVQYEEGEDAWDNTKRFHYNVDFVNYMMLVGNDVLLAQSVQRDSAEARKKRQEPMVNDSLVNKDKGGFLKNLFGGNKEEGKRRSDNMNDSGNDMATKPENEES